MSEVNVVWCDWCGARITDYYEKRITLIQRMDTVSTAKRHMCGKCAIKLLNANAYNYAMPSVNKQIVLRGK